ncbi:MAG: hypothetical protein MJ204_07345 [Bacteroidales bacterium]|nr:hypothetical protein [Bacteroidales bacterium]
MEDKVLISGLTVAQQMSKARFILNTVVIPRSELFKIRKKEGRLSKEVQDILKNENA